MVCGYLVGGITMIRLYNLQTGYQGQSIAIPLSGRFKFGSMTAIIGANGMGKSTLLKTLAGLLPPVAGRLEFGGTGRPRIGYLPQQVAMDRQFPLTIFDVVAMGCWPVTGLLRRISDCQRAAIWQALERVGLDGIPGRSISALSSGQFQRMLFARLLVQYAALILLDEPFSGIDNQTCDRLLEIINKLHRQECTIIVVLHDNQLVAQHFPDTLLLGKTRNIWGPSSRVLMQRSASATVLFSA